MIILIPDRYRGDSATQHNTLIAYKEGGVILIQPKISALIDTELPDNSREGFRPFGVCKCDSGVYVASNSKLVKFTKDLKEYKEIYTYPLFVNTHQISFDDSTGVLYTANTSTDTIGIYGGSVRFHNVNTGTLTNTIEIPKSTGDYDTRHVNSLLITDKYVYYCCHNFHRISKFYRMTKNGSNRELVLEAGYCCHNIVILHNKLYSLSSCTGELLEFNLTSKILKKYKIVSTATTEFLRGLQVYNNHLIIGVSNHYMCLATPKKDPFSRLIIFDIGTKEYKTYMEVKEMGVIADLLIL